MHVPLTAGRHAVLLIHGLFGNPREMQYLGRELHKAGFSVSIPHFSGYGHSTGDGNGSVAPWQAWVKQVHQEVARLRACHASVSVGGLCIGAVLALAVAAEGGQEISALSLMATTLAFDGWSLPWYRFLAPIAYYTPLGRQFAFPEREPYGIKNRLLRSLLVSQMHKRDGDFLVLPDIPLGAINESRKLIKYTRKMLPKVQVPALIIHAREDDIASVKNASLVAERIKSRETRVVVLQDSYHLITMDNERTKVVHESTEFFGRFARLRTAGEPTAKSDRIVVGAR